MLEYLQQFDIGTKGLVSTWVPQVPGHTRQAFCVCKNN